MTGSDAWGPEPYEFYVNLAVLIGFFALAIYGIPLTIDNQLAILVLSS
jgi:hypothetical protein